MNFHELKDLAMIYSSGKDNKPDYSWDKAHIVVWDPLDQQEMDLIFTGSERPDTKAGFPGVIHFNVSRKGNEHLVDDAFVETLKKIFPNISDEASKEYTKVFLETLYRIKHNL